MIAHLCRMFEAGEAYEITFFYFIFLIILNVLN